MNDLKLVLVVGSGFLFACGGSSTGGGNGGASGAGEGNGSAGAGTSGAANTSAGSGGGSSQTCASFSPCGGDLVGTWNIASFCATPPVLMNTTECADAVLNVTSSTESGSLTLNADLSVATSVTVVVGESAVFPPSCFTQAQCTEFQTLVAQSAGVSDVTCSYSASVGCSCSLNADSQQATTGTYTTSGTNVTVVTAGADPETDSYCVSGNTLTIQNTDPDGNVTTIVSKM